jgi:hypothetical protein
MSFVAVLTLPLGLSADPVAKEKLLEPVKQAGG